MKKGKVKAVIMAGGNGTRLWPMSTSKQPKQFQPLASDKSMLQETYNRMTDNFLPQDIYVATNENYVDIVLEQLTDLPEKNVIAETALRDTASAVALIAGLIAHEDEDAIVAVFPSDHVIRNGEVLVKGINVASEYIAHNPAAILTFGIMPTHPDVGYGYIKKAEPIEGTGDDTVFRAERFVEKPDQETAQKYLDEGGYYWNAGMFVFHAGEMLAKFKQFVPDTYARIVKITEAIGLEEFDHILREEYAGMDKISVDYAIMENAKEIALIPLALSWSDVGDWVRLKEIVEPDVEANLSRGDHVDFKSRNVVVFGSSKPIVTAGLEDVIVVDTSDALLVCSNHEAPNLSKYVKEMGAGDYEHLL